MERFVSAVSAGAGGFVSSYTLYPIEIVKNQVQMSTSSSEGERPSFTSQARNLWKLKGAAGFYKGALEGSLQSMTEKTLYFYNFTTLQGLYEASFGEPSVAALLILGYFSEWGHLPFTLPMDVSLKRYQSSQRHAETADMSWLDCVKTNYAEKGVRGFYRGIDAHLILCAKPAIQYGVFESVKRRLGSGADLSAVQAFALGATARALSTLLVFPFIRGQVVLTTRKKGEGRAGGGTGDGAEEEEPKTVLQTVRWIAKTRGVSALYQGLGPQLGRGVLSAALTMMVKERIAAYVRTFIIWLFMQLMRLRMRLRG